MYSNNKNIVHYLDGLLNLQTRKLPPLQNFISVLGDNELRRSSLASERYRLWWHPFSYDLDKTRENTHLQQACRETQK